MNDNKTKSVEDLIVFSEKVSNNYKNFKVQNNVEKVPYVQTSVFCGYPGIGKTTFFKEDFWIDDFDENKTTKLYIDCFKIQDNFNQKIVSEIVRNGNYHSNKKRNNLQIFKWFFNLSAKCQEVFLVFLNVFFIPIIGLLSGTLLLTINDNKKSYMWAILGISLLLIVIETAILCIGMHHKNLLAIKSKCLINKKIKNLIIIFDEIDRISDANTRRDIFVNIALIREHLVNLRWFESINFIISTNKSIANNDETKTEDNLFFYHDKKICDVVYEVKNIELEQAREIFEQYLNFPEKHIILDLIYNQSFNNYINDIFNPFNRRIFQKMIDTIHRLLSDDNKFIKKLFKDENEYHIALFNYAIKKYYDKNFDFNIQLDEVLNLNFTNDSTLRILNYIIFKFIDNPDFNLRKKLEKIMDTLKDVENKLENLMNESGYWEFWKEILYDQNLIGYFEEKGFIYLLKNLINKYEDKFNYELKNNDVIYDWTQIKSKELVNICNLINSKIIEKNFNKSTLSLMTGNINDEWLPWEEKKLIYKLYLFNTKSLGSLIFINKDNSFFPEVGNERDKVIFLNYPFEFISISEKWNDSLFKVRESNLIKRQWNEEKWYLRLLHNIHDVNNWNSKFVKAYHQYISSFKIEAAKKETFNIFGIVKAENNDSSFYRNELRENDILISLLNFLDYVRDYRIKEEFDKLLDLQTIKKYITSNKDLILHLDNGWVH